jgi:transposase-like protein
VQVFTELKKRGLDGVFIAVCDGLKGLMEAIHDLGADDRAAVRRAPNPQ